MGLTRIRADQISDIDYKQAVRVIELTNVTLTGGAPAVVDGVSLNLNNRVLVAGQSTTSQNGLYDVTVVGTGSDGTWTRTSDTNATGEINAGMIVAVTEGSTYADTLWMLITDNPITIGSTGLVFQQTTGNGGAYGNANVSTYLSSGNVTANIITTAVISAGGNIFGGGLISATSTITSAANVVGGNITTVGLITATGNVTGNYFIGNGSQLTGILTLASAMTWTTQANTAPTGVAPGSYWYDSYSSVKYQYTNDGTGNVWVDQSFPTSFTTLAVTGNATIGGNLGVTGTISYGNISTTGFISGTGNVTGGNIQTAGLVTATGNVTGGNILTAGLMSSTGNAIHGNILTAGLFSATGNATAGNILTAGLISATGAITGGSATVGTGNITAGNLLISGAIVDSAQLDIQTSASNANIVLTPNGSGNVNTGANVSVTGNVQAGNIRTAGLVSATGNVIGGNITTANQLVSTVATGTAPLAITSTTRVNNLNVASSNVADYVAAGGAINGQFFVGLISATSGYVQSLGNSNIIANASTGLLQSTLLSATSNITGGNITTAGLITATGNVTGGNILTAGLMSSTGNAIHGNILTAGLISATGNITSGNLSVGTGTITVGNIVNSNANAVGNIGSASLYFNTVFAKATSALYADLAEMYAADRDYAPGTVVEFGDPEEIRASQLSHSTSVAGIISTNPSYLMNAAQLGKHVLPVALTGRVPCRVVGKIIKGDRLVASDIPGVATVLDIAKYEPSCIIGKALENYDSREPGVIEVVVGRT